MVGMLDIEHTEETLPGAGTMWKMIVVNETRLRAWAVTTQRWNGLHVAELHT